MPKFIINENCRLHNQLLIGNDFCGRELPQYIVALPTGDKMRNMVHVPRKMETIKITGQKAC